MGAKPVSSATARLVRVGGYTLLVVVALACGDRKAPAPSNEGGTRCSLPTPPGNQGVVVAKGIDLLSSSPTIRWHSPIDGRVHEVGADPMRPVDLGSLETLGAPLWDDASWYRVVCFDDCENASGPRLGVERVDKRTGARQRLGVGDYGLGSVTLFGDYVYWGINGHDVDGGVRRVLRRGGAQEPLRIWAKRDDHVRMLKPYAGRGLLVIGEASVAWIRRNEAKGVVLFTSDTFIGDAVVDDEYVFIAERGRRYDDRSGYVYRVSIATGVKQRLTGPLDEPSRIAVHEDRIYFMLGASPDVWSVSKTGGAPTKVVSGEPYDVSKGEQTLALWALECGLMWLHGNSAIATTQTLRFRPW